VAKRAGDSRKNCNGGPNHQSEIRRKNASCNAVFAVRGPDDNRGDETLLSEIHRDRLKAKTEVRFAKKPLRKYPAAFCCLDNTRPLMYIVHYEQAEHRAALSGNQVLG
jgi:hypothetical protein